MSGLLELGPMTREIDVMGKKLVLHPITVQQLIILFAKYPTIVELLEGQDKMLDVIATIGPQAVASFIACSTGEMLNPEAEAVALELGAGKTAEIVEAIHDITFEGGARPFVDRIKKLSAGTFRLSTSLEKESSETWSASLVGDAPRKPRLVPRRASWPTG